MDIKCKSISEIKSLLESGALKSENLIEDILENVKKNNKNYSVLNHRAMEMAKKVDEKILKGEKLKGLSGIPMAIEDSISTKGILTQAGSKILEGYIPVYNGTLVEKLYDEKAILIGKGNLGEFGLDTRDNPYGTAQALIDGQAAFGIVLDTSGQVRLASAKYGLFGLRPTYGAISRYGVIAHASSIDQVGIMGKNVEDLSLILNILMDKDNRDSTSVEVEKIDLKVMKESRIEDFKIALGKEYFEALDKDMKEKLEEVIKNLKDLGAKIEYVSIPSLGYAKSTYEIISSAEFSSNSARYDGISYGHRAKDYEDVDQLYKKTRTEGFGLKVKEKILFGNYVISEDQYEDYYEKSQRLRSKLQDEFDNAFKEYDLILSPVNGESVLASNLAGLPSMSLPAEDHMEKPIGLQIIGPKMKEKNLLNFAYSYEKQLLKVGGVK